MAKENPLKIFKEHYLAHLTILRLFYIRVISHNSRTCLKVPKLSFPLFPAPSSPTFSMIRIKIDSILAIALIGIVFIFNLIYIHPVLAAETSTGSELFQDNCASCHRGGVNILIEQKTLEKTALSKYLENYEQEPIKAIISQIKNGKNAMPAFKNKLSEQDILDIAAYVFQKAETGW